MNISLGSYLKVRGMAMSIHVHLATIEALAWWVF